MDKLKIQEKDIRHKTVSFDLKEAKEISRDGQKFGIIKGYASTYNNIDRGGDLILPGAFTKSLERYKEKNRQIRMLYQHDNYSLIGGYPIDKVKDDENGLYVEGEINLNVQKGAEAYALAKQGVLTDLSIGYSLIDYTVDEDTGVFILKEIELWEVSTVAEPMNANANILEVKEITAKEISSLSTIADVEKFFKESFKLSANQRKTLISKIKSFSRDVESANQSSVIRDELVEKIDTFVTSQKLDQIIKFLGGN